MKTTPVLTWPELSRLLDYSYCAGNDAETIRQFQQQRATAMRRFPACPGLPLSAHDHGAAWSATLFSTCPDLQPGHTDTSSPFSTYRFLTSFIGASVDGGVPDARQQEVLQLLQKRFEVNRRIFGEYDQSVRRIGDDFTRLDHYGLLALALQTSYLESGYFSFLNTSVKVLDLVIFSGWTASNPLLLTLPLALESMILNELQTS